jgi:hypothetical protein
VFLARAHGIKEGEGDTLVVVKSLLSKEDNHQFEYRLQIDMFGKLDSDNVVKLLGVCREIEPQFMILEYCEWVSDVVLVGLNMVLHKLHSIGFLPCYAKPNYAYWHCLLQKTVSTSKGVKDWCPLLKKL